MNYISEDKTRTFYDDYDESMRLTQDNRHLVEYHRKKFLYGCLINAYKPKTILQIACGTGAYTKCLCEIYPNIKITASDLIEKHVEQVPDYPNLTKLVWDCSTEILKSFGQFDMILVEGAWYHLEYGDRIKLLDNIKKLNAKVVVIDWLSKFHEYIQRTLQDQTTANFYNPRSGSPFVFDTEEDIKYFTKKDFRNYKLRLYPVDLNIRFGFRDFNTLDAKTVRNFILDLNNHILLYSKQQTFILNSTEHGCYVLTHKNLE